MDELPCPMGRKPGFPFAFSCASMSAEPTCECSAAGGVPVERPFGERCDSPSTGKEAGCVSNAAGGAAILATGDDPKGSLWSTDLEAGVRLDSGLRVGGRDCLGGVNFRADRLIL